MSSSQGRVACVVGFVVEVHQFILYTPDIRENYAAVLKPTRKEETNKISKKDRFLMTVYFPLKSLSSKINLFPYCINKK
jgi:hypothetical protein